MLYIKGEAAAGVRRKQKKNKKTPHTTMDHRVVNVGCCTQKERGCCTQKEKGVKGE
jgi:hypothetical protein